MSLPCGYYYNCFVAELKIWEYDASGSSFNKHRINLAMLDDFCFLHMKLSIVFSWSVKNCVGNSVRITLILQIALVNVTIFTMLIPSPSNFFLQILGVFVVQIFHLLDKSYPKIFFIVCAYCEGIYFPDFFLVHMPFV